MNLIRLFENSPTIIEVDVGGLIFERGDAGAEMYVLLEGKVEVRLGDRSLENIEAGGFFGEMALIDPAARSATAVAQTKCKLAVVDESRFLYMVEQTPFFALQVLRTLVARVREMNRRIE